MKQLLFILVCVLAFWPLQKIQALTIAPARIELAADPGVSVSDQFIAINDQDSKTFFITTENFTSQGEGGAPAFTTANEGLASWIKVDSQVTVEKGKEAKIPFTIDIPADAENGGYFAAIFLNTTPPDPSGASNVTVGAKLGVLVFLRVGQDIKEDGGIVEFKTIGDQTLFTALPINFFYRFKNSGGDRVKPRGQVKITNLFGRTSANLDANPQEGNILPSSTRRFELNWGGNQTVPGGFFDLVSYQAKHFALGRYKAQLALTYGAASTVVTQDYVVWILPWQLLAVILAVLLIVFFIFKFGLKRYNRWVIAQARASMR